MEKEPQEKNQRGIRQQENQEEQKKEICRAMEKETQKDKGDLEAVQAKKYMQEDANDEKFDKNQDLTADMRIITKGLQDQSRNTMKGRLLQHGDGTERWQVHLDFGEIGKISPTILPAFAVTISRLTPAGTHAQFLQDLNIHSLLVLFVQGFRVSFAHGMFEAAMTLSQA